VPGFFIVEDPGTEPSRERKTEEIEMINTSCISKNPCALRDIVIALNGDRDEDRRAQNDRAWRALHREAVRSGDDFGYDGPLPLTM